VDAFRPVAVERPGGGRIADKAPPPLAELVEVAGLEGRIVPLHRLAAQAWAALVDAARGEGVAEPLLAPVSGYRNSEEQEWLWREALEKYGDPEVACLWVARPGTSAHQSGRAVDCHLGAPIESEHVGWMRQQPTWKWLVANAVSFGYYPYEIEPWHWEYNPPWPVSAGTGE
jgi:LAS superfamily LD-carboxypeptidase LdcB